MEEVKAKKGCTDAESDGVNRERREEDNEESEGGGEEERAGRGSMGGKTWGCVGKQNLMNIQTQLTMTPSSPKEPVLCIRYRGVFVIIVINQWLMRRNLLSKPAVSRKNDRKRFTISKRLFLSTVFPIRCTCLQ